MDIERFGARMIALLPQLVRGFARHESNYLSRGQITLPQLWALEYLSRQAGDGSPMNHVARFLGVSRPAATGLMSRLIVQGLVSRAGDPRDRRVVRIRISGKGRRIVANIWEQKRRMVVQVFGRISPDDRAQYLATLERVVESLGREPAERRTVRARSLGMR